MLIVPPAPMPHTARATINDSIEFDKPHQRFVSANMESTMVYTDFLPIESEIRPQTGWKLVLVIIKAVVSHEALFDASK